MTLGISTEMLTGEGDSQFLPIVKYAAEAGRFFRIDREGGSNGYESVPTELPIGTKFLADFGSIQVGWMAFSEMGPSFALAPLGQAMPARPSKEHRQGFKMLIHLGKNGGVREFASSAKTLLGVVDELHTAYEQASEAVQGMVPIVEFSGTTMMKMQNKYGSKITYRPVFNIVGWNTRPKDFGERSVPVPGAKAAAPAPAKTNGASAQPRPAASNPRHVPPPAKVEEDEWSAPATGVASGIPLPPVGSSIDDEIPFGACWQ